MYNRLLGRYLYTVLQACMYVFIKHGKYMLAVWHMHVMGVQVHNTAYNTHLARFKEHVDINLLPYC